MNLDLYESIYFTTYFITKITSFSASENMTIDRFKQLLLKYLNEKETVLDEVQNDGGRQRLYEY